MTGTAFFDIDTGRRVNVSRSITIGPHVWLSRDAVVLGGVRIGEGTVVGYRSLVTRSLPYKPDASAITKSLYWKPTVDLPDPSVAVDPTPRPLGRRVKARLRRLRNR